MTDQWLLDGDCGKCRRVNYCKTTCTKRKRAMKELVQRAFAEAMAEKLREEENKK